MKRIITFAVLIVLTIAAHAQIEQYRTYKLTFHEEWNVEKNQYDKKTDHKATWLLTWDIKGQVLTIHSNEPIKIFVVTQREAAKTEKDADGDEYKTVKWNAVDQDGIQCLLVSRDWLEFDIRNWTLVYPGIATEFYCDYLR